MPNVFKPQANTLAKASVAMSLILPVAVLYAGVTFSRSPANTKVNVPMDQPIPFSHKHHAWELGIDCRFCHISVEKGAVASVPPTETCMTCHSQIWTNSPLLEPVRKSWETGAPIKFVNGDVGWNKVNTVPDFVYFNHSIHIDRGISCSICHGAITDQQITEKGNPFQMRWCLDCHRNTERFLYKDPEQPNLSPRQQVFNLYLKLQEGAKLTRREQDILNGRGDTYKPTEFEIKEGLALVKEYGVIKAQNSDCSTCHH